MKFTKMMLCLGTLALGVATAETRYSLELGASTWVGNTELKPGKYKVAMQGDKAVFTSGTRVAEAPASLVSGTQKYRDTAVETNAESKITAIQLGGTSAKILLKSTESVAAGN